MDVSEAEKITGQKATQDTSIIARNGIDLMIETESVKLKFDHGRLKAIQFKEKFDFSIRLQPFRERWMNPPVYDGVSPKPGMTVHEFDKYLEKWEADLVRNGYRRCDSGPKKDMEFSISHRTDSVLNNYFISFGPTRKTRGASGLWSSGWFFDFLPPPLGKNLLENVIVDDDDNNSVGR
jgi:hypothetical protein